MTLLFISGALLETSFVMINCVISRLLELISKLCEKHAWWAGFGTSPLTSWKPFLKSLRYKALHPYELLNQIYGVSYLIPALVQLPVSPGASDLNSPTCSNAKLALAIMVLLAT